LPAIGDGYRASAPFGMITLLDGGKESVHVHQCDGAGPDLRAIFSALICISHML
jgi:hypothetical protein